MTETFRRRDLTVVPLPPSGKKCLVLACDSCGGVGEKPGDVLKLPPYLAAKFTARVALTEIICSGAAPVAITNGVSCEMDPTGAETIAGVRDELREAGAGGIALTGSTEENFASCMTAVAVTAVGIAEEKKLKFCKASKGDAFILLGRPLCGDSVDTASKGYYPEIRKLLMMRGVREIVPVGSGGVLREALSLAALNGSGFLPAETEVDCVTSAGPATCLLVLCAASYANRVAGVYGESFLLGEIS